MYKTRVVVQGPEGCRILVNPSPSLYENKPHLINPDLSGVRGVSPEQWEIVNGALVCDMGNVLPTIHEVTSDPRIADLYHKIAVLRGSIWKNVRSRVVLTHAAAWVTLQVITWLWSR